MRPKPLPIIGPIPQVLLLCSRETLSLAQEERIVDLCRLIDDWSRFVEQSEFRLVLPLVHRHLERLQPAALPAHVLESLQVRALRIVMQNFTLAAAYQRLAREVFEPLQIQYAFAKGLAVAYRYYREPGLRMARDIDVLVHRPALLRLDKRLRELAYALSPVPRSHDDSLRFHARFFGSTNWDSPEGVHIEFHASTDQPWGRLQTQQLIAAAEPVAIGGVSVCAMSSKDQFVHLCWHHTRHHWARLHWIADLNATLQSPALDLSAALDHARCHGFERTVNAALAVAHAAEQPEPWKAQFEDPFAHEVFRHCLMNLEGDFEQERALRLRFSTQDIDIAPVRQRLDRAFGRTLRALRPQLIDYQHLPLPHRYHWAYYLLRPILWTIRKLQRGKRRA